MVKTLEQRIAEAEQALTAVEIAVNRNANVVPIEVETWFRERVDHRTTMAGWPQLLATREAVRKMIDGLERNVTGSDDVEILSQPMKYEHLRLVGSMAWMTAAWAAADSITEVVGDLVRPTKRLKSVKLVSHFVSEEKAHESERDKIPFLLYKEIRKTFGWPIGLSYAVRNHLVHDGGQSSGRNFFEDGPGSTSAFRISQEGWDFVCGKARAYGVADSGFSRATDWPSSPTDDFRVLMDVCIREMDDALGVLLGYACTSLKTNVAFMLRED